MAVTYVQLRGPANETMKRDTVIGREKTLTNIPEEFNQLESADVPAEKPKPMFSQPLTTEWLDTSEPSDDYCANYRTRDLVWILARLHHSQQQKIPGWTPFNQVLSTNTDLKTTIGYLPIIPAPAHDLDTVLTVLLRCERWHRN